MAFKYLGLKTIVLTLTGVAQRISATDYNCYGFEIYAPTSTIYVGDSGVDATYRPIIKSGSFSPSDVLLAGTTDQYNLKEVWVLGTAGDTAIITASANIVE